MSFNILQLTVRSRNSYQTNKEITVCNAEQIHKMTTQNEVWVKIVAILWIFSALQRVIFSSLR